MGSVVTVVYKGPVHKAQGELCLALQRYDCHNSVLRGDHLPTSIMQLCNNITVVRDASTVLVRDRTEYAKWERVCPKGVIDKDQRWC